MFTCGHDAKHATVGTATNPTNGTGCFGRLFAGVCAIPRFVFVLLLHVDPPLMMTDDGSDDGYSGVVVMWISVVVPKL